MDTWQLAGRTARFTSPSRQGPSRQGLDGWQAQFQLDRPSLGLHPVAEAGAATRSTSAVDFVDHLLGVELPEFCEPIAQASMVDHYIRQQDLVVTYQRDQPQHLRPQIDWRYVEQSVDDRSGRPTACSGIQLLVSLTTNRLDAQPTLSVASRFQADEVLSLVARAAVNTSDATDLADANLSSEPVGGHPIVLFRRDGQEHSWVQMIYPSDLLRLELTSCRQTGCESRLRMLGEHLEKGVIRRVQLAAWRVPREHDRQIARQLFRQFVVSPPPISV